MQRLNVFKLFRYDTFSIYKTWMEKFSPFERYFPKRGVFSLKCIFLFDLFLFNSASPHSEILMQKLQTINLVGMRSVPRVVCVYLKNAIYGSN